MIFTGLFCYCQIWGQGNPLSSALESYKAGELAKARSVIDSLAGCEGPFTNQTVTYYLKGFIYKDLYKQNTTNDSSRAVSVIAFKQALALDNEGKYGKEITQNLKFMASTYYNDAMRKIDERQFDKAITYFDNYDGIIGHIDNHQFNLKENKEKFLLALGSGFMNAIEISNDSTYFDKALVSFKKVLAIDSLNRDANYNVGVLYYNQAVNIIVDMDYDEVDLLTFDKLENEVNDLFRTALPYLNRVYDINPNDERILEGLSGIYFGLHELDKYNRFQKELTAVR